MTPQNRPVKLVRFNFRADAAGHDLSDTYFVGWKSQDGNTVIRIDEHSPRGSGDTWYYDVIFDDDTYMRIFNPNFVAYDKAPKPLPTKTEEWKYDDSIPF